MSNYDIGMLTDTGRHRVRNEDYLLVLKDQGLVGVFDGMGGHQDGNVASKLAAKSVAETFHKVMGSPEDRLRQSLGAAHLAILNAQNGNMGSTGVIAHLGDSAAAVVWAGDSRAYRFRARDKTLHQTTWDHSIAGQLVHSGQITPEQAKSAHQGLICHLGLPAEYPFTISDCLVKLETGDMLLLCSDGLTNAIEDYDIRSALSGNDSCDDICQELVDRANAAGGPDNISVVLARRLA